MEYLSKLNPHLKDRLGGPPTGEPSWVAAADLLSSRRLDVVAKYLYARDYLLGVEEISAREIYASHLRILNGLKEGDGSGKEGLAAFEQQFQALINSINEQGFNDEISLLPVGHDNAIIDGAHRLAACLLLDKPVKTLTFDRPANDYGADHLRRIGYPDQLLETLVAEYCRLKPQVRVAVVFPMREGSLDIAISELEQQGTVVFRKSLRLDKTGKTNLVRTLYHGEAWLQNSDRNSGVQYHVAKRFRADQPVEVIIFETNHPERLSECKERIRERYKKGNHSIHINDHHAQTTELTDLILSENGLHWLNNARFQPFPKFEDFFSRYRSALMAHPPLREQYCLDGSAAMAIYGLRDVGDLDYIWFNQADPLAKKYQGIADHNDQLHHHGLSREQIIFSEQRFFRYRGVKCLALGSLRRMKARRGEPKDQNDVLLIDQIDTEIALSLAEIGRRLATRLRYLKYRVRSILAGRLPEPIKNFLKSVYLLPSRLVEAVGSEEQSINYLGYDVVFDKGNSLIERIKISGRYEPELVNFFCSKLFQLDHPVVLDIGANIGLISLNLVKSLEGVTVYAFEPGPHQYRYLAENVRRNELQQVVRVSNIALSDRNGVQSFFTHENKHSSGDGFFDTRRAGKSEAIQVETATLDSWWEAQGRLTVDALKIDTEGAELMILQGGRALLADQKPLIVLEIHPLNLRVYPYTEMDIFQFLQDIGYQLETLTGIGVTDANFVSLLAEHNDYVARSRY